MGNTVVKDESVGRSITEMAGQPSDVLDHCTLVSKSNHLEVFQDNRGGELFYLRNRVDRILKDMTHDDITALVRMEKRLPRSIMPLLYSLETQPGNSPSQVSFLTQVSPITLETELDRLREQGMTFNETDVWAIMGVLFLTASLMEQGMNYHKAICLKNVFVSETRHQIFLLNPFVLDAYLEGVLHQLIGPLIRNAGWREEYWTNHSLREQAAQYYPDIKKCVQESQMNSHQMVISVVLIGLQIASGLTEDYFMTESGGTLDKMRINQAIDSIRNRYSSTLKTFFRSVFTSVQRGEILNSSSLLATQLSQVKTLINSSIAESAYTNEIFVEGNANYSNVGGPVVVSHSKMNMNPSSGGYGKPDLQQSGLQNQQGTGVRQNRTQGNQLGGNLSQSRVVDRLSDQHSNSRERINHQGPFTQLIPTGLPPLPPQQISEEDLAAPGSYVCLKQERSNSRSSNGARNRRASPNRIRSGTSSSRRVSPNHITGDSGSTQSYRGNANSIPVAMRNYNTISSFRPTTQVSPQHTSIRNEQTVLKHPQPRPTVTQTTTYISGHPAFIHKPSPPTLGPLIQIRPSPASPLTLRPSARQASSLVPSPNTIPSLHTHIQQQAHPSPSRTIHRQADLGDRHSSPSPDLIRTHPSN